MPTPSLFPIFLKAQSGGGGGVTGTEYIERLDLEFVDMEIDVEIIDYMIDVEIIEVIDVEVVDDPIDVEIC
jgi:hypothetical protein